MERSQDSLKKWEWRAEAGDPDAQISLAWECAVGEHVEKDFGRAVALFRQAEKKKPALARFYLAKAKLMNKDETFKDDLVEDCKAGFGPALYIMGAGERDGVGGRNNMNEALRYFKLAAQNGHLVSEGFVWRFQRKSIWQWLSTLLYAGRLLSRIAVIKYRNPEDLRVLT